MARAHIGGPQGARTTGGSGHSPGRSGVLTLQSSGGLGVQSPSPQLSQGHALPGGARLGQLKLNWVRYWWKTRFKKIMSSSPNTSPHPLALPSASPHPGPSEPIWCFACGAGGLSAFGRCYSEALFRDETMSMPTLVADGWQLAAWQSQLGWYVGNSEQQVSRSVPNGHRCQGKGVRTGEGRKLVRKLEAI